jgi:DNA (cytosine-5)-methyltransferase 1
LSDINVRQQLLKLYGSSLDISDISGELEEQLVVDTDFIVGRVASNKGVYTVLITLALYKYLNPTQDIRNHKIELPNGFSGRSFDKANVTPVLKELNLPAMAESGWLTRSLEQAYAFDMDFNGKITPVELKWAFLRTVATIQKGKQDAQNVIRVLLNGGIEYRENNKVEIHRINSDDAQISTILKLLEECFTTNYSTHGGSKLPVLAFYAIYSLIVPEMGRYSGATLLPLGSHTASDRTSKSAGDIEVSRDDCILEALEVKLDKPATAHMVRVAFEKINKFGVSRYYILSGLEPDPSDVDEINQLIFEIEQEHGCQLIVNGLYQSLKYYLRLVSSPKAFVDTFVDLVEADKELSTIHKTTLSELLKKHFG